MPIIYSPFLCKEHLSSESIYIFIYEKHKNTPFNSVNDINIIEKRQYGSSEVIILKKLSSSTK